MNKDIKDKLGIIMINLRFLIIPALIVTTLIGSLILLFSINKFIEFVSKGILRLDVNDIIIETLTILDLVLVGIVFFIFSFSLYELFIKRNDSEKTLKEILPNAFFVKDLDSLKSKLGRVIILILIITFLKLILKYKFQDMLEILMFSISIFFISLSLYFTRK